MLVIGKNKWAPDTLNNAQYPQIWQALTELPPPPMGQYTDIAPDPEKTVLCFEQEFVYIHAKGAIDTNEFIGTKYIARCITLYFFTAEDHLILHVNGKTAEIDIAPYIALFSCRGNVSVSLLGGFKTEQSFKNSAINVLITITKILASFGFNLIAKNTLLGNKIVASNEVTIKLVLDYLESKIKFICHHWYGRPLHENLFSSEKRRLLFQKLINGTLILDEYLQNLAPHIATAVSMASDLYDPTSPKDVNNFNSLMRAKEHFSTENFFLDVIEHIIFNAPACNTFKQAIPQLFALKDVVFSLKTGKAYLISAHLKTPYESVRTLLAYDFNRYTLAYSSYGGYVPPKIRKTFHEKITAIFKDNKIKSKLTALSAIGYASLLTFPEGVVAAFYGYHASPCEFFVVDNEQLSQYEPPQIYPGFIGTFYKCVLQESYSIFALKKILQKLLGHSNSVIKALARKNETLEFDITINVDSTQTAMKIREFLEQYRIPVFLVFNKQQLQLWLLAANVPTSRAYAFLYKTRPSEQLAVIQ